jgi:2-oxo-4-hydroxy-4-carboxy--5-ureidoimidazoline (OHCU) decarboxylase
MRPDEGSFNTGLQKLFYLASNDNRIKLIRAFPEFFGTEVSEFGITADIMQNA